MSDTPIYTERTGKNERKVLADDFHRLSSRLSIWSLEGISESLWQKGPAENISFHMSLAMLTKSTDLQT